MTARKMQARQARAQTEAPEVMTLGQQVAERGAERPGQDVGDPERQDRVEPRSDGRPRPRG